MKHKICTFIFIASRIFLPCKGWGQTAGNFTAVAAAPAISPRALPVASSGNEKGTLLPQWVQFGGVVRGRFEGPSGMSFVPGASDGYYLSRARMDVTVRPTSWLRIYGEGQDARVLGYNAPSQPASMHNALDIRQAYIDMSREDKLGLDVKVGRQELKLGSGRLFGISDWGLSRTFDAARVGLYQSTVKFDVFAASLVQLDASRCDRHKPGEQVYGSYSTFEKWGPAFVVEQYVFLKRQVGVTGENGAMGDAMVGTLGFRLLGKLPARLDYSAELARQWGPYAGDHVSAMAGLYILGWTVNKSPSKPRISFEYDHASGDPSSKDGVRQTFDQMYASNHSSYANPNLMGLKNMKNPRLGFEWTPGKKVKLQADLNEFYLASTQDGYYNASSARLVLNRNATSRHIGTEISLLSTIQLTKKLSLGAGIVHLFAGEYLKQSTGGSGYNYPYLSFTKRL